MEKVIGEQLSVAEVWGYGFVNMSKDLPGLEVESFDRQQVEPSDNSENAIADECACRIEKDVIDVYGTRASAENNRHDQLGKLKGTADRHESPCNPFRSDRNNELNKKAKGNSKQNIIDNIFGAVLRQIIETTTKVERNEVEIQAKPRMGWFYTKWKNSHADRSDEIKAKNGGEENLVKATSSRTKKSKSQREQDQRKIEEGWVEVNKHIGVIPKTHAEYYPSSNHRASLCVAIQNAV